MVVSDCNAFNDAGSRSKCKVECLRSPYTCDAHVWVPTVDWLSSSTLVVVGTTLKFSPQQVLHVNDATTIVHIVCVALIVRWTDASAIGFRANAAERLVLVITRLLHTYRSRDH